MKKLKKPPVCGCGHQHSGHRQDGRCYFCPCKEFKPRAFKPKGPDNFERIVRALAKIGNIDSTGQRLKIERIKNRAKVFVAKQPKAEIDGLRRVKP